MLELLSAAIALIGSTIAGIWDLKTTEIPDEIPDVMIILGLTIVFIESVFSSNYWYLINSLIYGIGFFCFGFLMYYLGQWGGGDAKILSAIGFLLPFSPLPYDYLFPFPISFLFNVFIIGAVYMLAYAFIFALINRNVISKFVKDIKGSRKVLSIGSIILLISFLALNWFFSNYLLNEQNVLSIVYNSLLLLFASISLFILFKFARSVENFGFKMKVPVSKLKVGDVLLDSKVFEGITEKELKKIRRSGKRYVWVKEGVRFGLAFPIALIFTLFFGDSILFLIRFLF